MQHLAQAIPEAHYVTASKVPRPALAAIYPKKMPIAVCMHNGVQQVRGIIKMQVAALFQLFAFHVKVAQEAPGEEIESKVRIHLCTEKNL